MAKRNYNVFFNTHTVSGIVISVALYVIFFAGAFALFKDEIALWENGKPTSYTQRQNIDYDGILKTLEKDYNLTGRDLQLNFGHHEDQIYVLLNASRDSLATDDDLKRHYFSVNIHDFKQTPYEEYYNLGEFLYRLHYFTQIPTVGIYIAGFVSLFFLFAIVTGVIVHCKKIISNFYAFNPKIALKRVWTDAHTALGIIGLPYQFIFAVTGAYFCLSLLVLIPANFLYNNNQEKLMQDLRPDRTTYEWIAPSEAEIPSFNDFAKDVQSQWNDFHLTRAFIKNYGGTNMKYLVMGELDYKTKFIGPGWTQKDIYSNTIDAQRNPYDIKYTEDVQFALGRLHFGDFGGISVKLIYFVLALITCFVILSGVLIWVEARNKKSMSLKQRLYTAKVGHIYLAICLTMLPVTALAFLFVKWFGDLFTNKFSTLYWFYFITWLIFILIFRYKRDNYFTNKYTLLLGAIFGGLIPISNGITSGQWLWKSYTNNQTDIFLVDALWLGIATVALLIFFKIKPKVKTQSAYSKHPIDFKNRKALLAEENNTSLQPKENTENINYIPMRTKISILWLFLALGWIVHHLYGLFNIYYNETLILDGATGEAPLEHHLYRILFEGICLLFALFTLEVKASWFKLTAFIWAIIGGLYNIYHLVTALIYESGNISELFMLLLVTIASVFLIKNLNVWRKG